MTTAQTFTELALSIPEVNKNLQGDKTVFKYKSKKFASLNTPHKRSTLKFLPHEQEMLCKVNPEAIFPVPNKFGKYGWTHVLYEKVESEILLELLKTAYLSVRPNFSFDQ